MHHTKDKGDIAVAQTIAALTIQGWVVAVPFSEHQPYDLLIEKDGTCARVQVKFVKPQSNGNLKADLRSCWADQNGIHSSKRQANSFDVLAVYCPETHKVYFVREDEIQGQSYHTIKPVDENACLSSLTGLERISSKDSGEGSNPS